MHLRIPGPTPLPPAVVAALQRPMIDHRGPEFVALTQRLVRGLRSVFQTDGDILLFTCSGTGGLECAVVNTLSPGDRVLSLSAGNFGDRLAAIAAAYGILVVKRDFPPGQRVDPAAVSDALSAAPDVRAVLLTHNETSTGVCHPLREIARAVRDRSEAVLIVDAVSSLGAIEVAMDRWGVDVLVTSSQKAWMCPPGLAMVGIGWRAWKAHALAKAPRFYYDWLEYKNSLEKGVTPFTPALSVYYALEAALALMEREGLANVYHRHERVAALARSRAIALGFELLPDPRDASATVTALRPPAGLDADAVRRIARDELGVVFGGGQGQLRGKIIRVGHMGFVSEPDVEAAMESLGEAARRLSTHREAARP